MGLTAFPNGISSFGVPVLGNVFGVPFTGNYWFVNPLSGLDGNSGKSPSQALQTLDQAHTLAVAGNNDVVILIGDGSTDATAREAATLTWSKNATHLVGVCAPSLYSQRARISTPTAQATNINPLMNITASGCLFANFSFFQGVGQASTDEQLITIGGSRNYFGNVDFGGMGHANGAARSGSYIIGLTGSENLFQHCAIGLETIARSAANASVKLLAAGASRNDFEDCVFPMYPTANSPLFLDASLANALNGGTMGFTRCRFRGLVGASGYTQPSVTASISATVNGVVYFDDCSTIAAKYAANGGEVRTSASTNANGLYTAAT